MVKPKLKQPINKNGTSCDPDMEEFIQDGWVVVKKQKVTILIPPLPITKQCAIPYPGITPSQPIATKEVDHISALQPYPPLTLEKTMPLATTKPITTSSGPPKFNHRATAVNPHHISAPQPDPPLTLEKTMPLATTKLNTTSSSPPKLNHKATSVNPHNYQPNRRKTLGVCNASKARKHCGHLINGHMLVNSKMRALNLERKLQRAGGLNSWLVSLGLGQFVKIFRCQRIGKVQLMNLTMKKLKDMGAHAVGPRRKLMHAIDCLW